MTNIFKHESIGGRPVFKTDDIKYERPTQSRLKANPLLKRLKPSKNPSQFAAFFSENVGESL